MLIVEHIECFLHLFILREDCFTLLINKGQTLLYGGIPSRHQSIKVLISLIGIPVFFIHSMIERNSKSEVLNIRIPLPERSSGKNT
jgi:hypothetical protein